MIGPMIGPLALLTAAAAATSLMGTELALRLGRRLRAMDGSGVPGQVKAPPRRVPNTGGLGITLGLLLPIAGLLAVALLGLVPSWAGATALDLAQGLRSERTLALVTLSSLLVVHIMGLIDDRRPLPWLPKLLVMLAVPAALAWSTDTRVLTLLDARIGGAWLSVLITTVFFAVVMNAINFMDNMDGLAAGVSGVIAAGLSAVAVMQGQWIVAGGGAALLGACLGFLPHNYPRARVFMGDGGSLVLGFMLAFLLTRLNYLQTEADAARWDRLAVPLVLLAVPLYDLTAVVLIRLSQGRSPFVGDLQHLSHRFERRGLSRPRTTAIIWCLTAVPVLGAVVIARGEPWETALVAVQTLVALLSLALVEHRRRVMAEA